MLLSLSPERRQLFGVPPLPSEAAPFIPHVLLTRSIPIHHQSHEDVMNTIDLDTTIDLATSFAVVALPSSTPVDDDDIKIAHATLLDMYPEASPLRTRMENALLRVQQRHTWIFTEGVIHTGDQRVKLSKDQQEYICSCPDWTWKCKEHHGGVLMCACAHVRRAQAACTAAIAVSGSVLTHAIHTCCATGAADVRMQYDDTLG